MLEPDSDENLDGASLDPEEELSDIEPSNLEGELVEARLPVSCATNSISLDIYYR